VYFNDGIINGFLVVIQRSFLMLESRNYMLQQTLLLHLKGFLMHGDIIYHAIPFSIGITVSTMVMLTIYKDTLKMNCFL